MGTFNIKKTDGNLGRRDPEANMISGLVMGGIATGSLPLGQTSPKITSLAAAEALGIDESYDLTNKILVHYHIKEFFRINPDGELYIMLVAQGTTMTDMCDKANSYVQKLIVDSNGEVRQYGVVLNPASGYTSTLSGGFDQDVINAIPKAQELGSQAFKDKRPVIGVIEGREFNGTVATMDDLRSNEAEYACVTALQDPNVASKDALYENHAAVGTTLGAISLAPSNISIGWTENFNLQNKKTGEFTEVYMSDNNPASDYENFYEDLSDKGVLFGRIYTGQAGVYFDTFSSCADLESDYAYGQETRVVNKAARLLYDKLFKRIEGPLLVDPDNGQLAIEEVTEIEEEGNEALGEMSDEISGAATYVNPAQDVQTSGKVLMKFKVVNIATGRELEVEIGLAKSLN